MLLSLTPRAVLVALAFALLGLAVLYAQGRESGYTIAIGRVHPIEQEQQECVFPIGPAAAVLLHPEGAPCTRMREFIGQSGRLIFVPDP